MCLFLFAYRDVLIDFTISLMPIVPNNDRFDFNVNNLLKRLGTKLMEKQSHSGETNGEVVESEPNAPLQNLDSVNDTEAELHVQSQLSALIATNSGVAIAPSQAVSSASSSKEALASSSINFSLSSAGVPELEALSQSSLGKTADLQTTVLNRKKHLNRLKRNSPPLATS